MFYPYNCIIPHLTTTEEKSWEPKGNRPGTLIALENPSSTGGRNVGAVIVKYSNEFALPVVKKQEDRLFLL